MRSPQMSEAFNLSAALARPAAPVTIPPARLIGILPGEGVGPELIDVALTILTAVSATTSIQFEIITGGPIGLPARKETGRDLSDEVIDFCQSIFNRYGVIFCGPGGGRFVYELRSHFDLYCKFVPIRPIPALHDTGVLCPEARTGVDIVIVRENTGGVYLGEWGQDERHTTTAYHRFSYTETHVDRILKVAARLAGRRRQRLTVVLKPGGVPAISSLWQRKMQEVCAAFPLDLQMLEIDNAMYQIIANAHAFDVVVAPNMFGDVLADGAGLLLGSRGLCFSGNFNDTRAAVYQTGHGAAYDLTGTDQANPVGQIHALAMMLRESCHLPALAAAVEAAVEATLVAGFRTPDIAGIGNKTVGTVELGCRIADRVAKNCAKLDRCP